MSTAAAAAPEAGAPKKGKKKLIIIVAAVVVLALVGVGAALMLKKKSHAEDGEDGEAESPPPKAAVKHDPKAAPVFVPLDPFTVNLADREAERYAQVGITLEVTDAHVADQLKQYMPAVRNNILLALSDKTSAQLMERDGKTKLAAQVQRETARALGIEVDDEEDEAEEAKPKAETKKKKRKKKAHVESPVTAVHFSNFIIQ